MQPAGLRDAQTMEILASVQDVQERDVSGERPFVLQAHDELVFSVPNSEVEEASFLIKHEMTQAPDWLPDLPLAVELKTGVNYGNCKD